ncbi:MAG: hypothetical protein NZ750_10175 [Anaerolineae bacterium]|nr:hypothetical protein [Anaerolineae bacterium]MDW8172649.1 hypothetical protein [Anaerolineae bacterium]
MSRHHFMWADDSGGVQGAVLDLEAGCIQWFDQPGCACGEDEQFQSLSDFMAQGSVYLSPPPEVVAEIRGLVAAHLSQ